MAAVTVRNLAEATHRAIKHRAVLRGVSAEAEIRFILDEVALPEQRVRLGTWLYEKSRPFGGVDLKIRRDQTPSAAPDFE